MSVRTALRRVDPFDSALLLLAALLAALSLWLQSCQALNHDNAWYLIAASRWLDGASIYAETAFDPNPPMVLWLSAAVVFAARILGMAPETALRALAVLLCLFATLLAGKLLRIARIDARLRFVLLASFLTVVLSTAHREFAQREHFLTSLVLPYLCGAGDSETERSSTETLRIAAGLLLGLGLCLKPQYLLLPGAIALLRALGRAPMRHWLALPELCAGLALGIYLAVAMVTASAYFTTILPLANAVYYVGYARSLGWALTAAPSAALVLVLAGVATAVSIRRSPPSPERTLALSLFAGGAAAFAAFVVQRTGWPYQATPARALLSVALLYAMALLALQHRPQRSSQLSALIIVGACAFAASRLVRDYQGRHSDWSGARFVNRVVPAAGASIGFAALSTSLQPAFPAALYINRTWALRYPCLWMLPAVLAGSVRDDSGAWHPSPQMSQIDENMRRSVLADFERYRPGLILVNHAQAKQALSVPVDLLRYFLQDQPFRRFWEQYRECGANDEFALYCRY